MKKILILFAFALMLPLALMAQEVGSDAPKMSVNDFYYAANDVTANVKGTTIIDQNGEKCALIRIQTTEKDFNFSFGMTMPVKVEYKTGEVWVYVPHGVKTMTIRHSQLGTLKYSIPIQIDKARTYVMDLYTAEIRKVVVQTVRSGFVVLTVTPKDASVELDGKPLKVDEEGNASDYVEFGSHEYVVRCKDYYPKSDTVMVSSASQSRRKQVTLVEKFGYLVVDSDGINGASIFIDDELMGTVPNRVGPITAGEHTLRVAKLKYLPYTQTINISDRGSTTTAKVELAPNYSTVTLKAPDGVAIYINDIYKATGHWTGDLELGVVKIETRKSGCQSGIITRKIDTTDPLEIELPEPVPVYVTIAITANPTVCDIFIDDEPVGQSPIQIKVLKGSHTIKAQKDNYESKTQRIDVSEDNDGENKAHLVLSKSSYSGGAYAYGSSSYSSNNSSESSSGSSYNYTPKKVKRGTEKYFALQAAYVPAKVKLKPSSSSESSTNMGGINFGLARTYVYGSGVLFGWGLDIDMLFSNLGSSSSDEFAMVDMKVPLQLGYEFKLNKTRSNALNIGAGIDLGAYIYAKEKGSSESFDLLEDAMSPLLFDWHIALNFRFSVFKIGAILEAPILNQAKNDYSSAYDLRTWRGAILLGIEF